MPALDAGTFFYPRKKMAVSSTAMMKEMVRSQLIYFTKLRRTGNVFTLAGGTSSTRRGVASGPRLSR
jgi:hypothetical protein